MIRPDKRDAPRHHRRSIRLAGYDYSQPGAYFLTICTRDRVCLFGEVREGQMRLNEAGRMVEQCWLEIPNHFRHVVLDAFVVMPNHVHGIIVLSDMVGAKQVGAKHVSPLQQRSPFRSPSQTIGSVVRGFKIGVTKWFREHTDVHTVWQRNYYEHVIRDDESLNRIRAYIAENPLRWDMDRENPHASRPEPENAWRV